MGIVLFLRLLWSLFNIKTDIDLFIYYESHSDLKRCFHISSAYDFKCFHTKTQPFSVEKTIHIQMPIILLLE